MAYKGTFESGNLYALEGMKFVLSGEGEASAANDLFKNEKGSSASEAIDKLFQALAASQA